MLDSEVLNLFSDAGNRFRQRARCPLKLLAAGRTDCINQFDSKTPQLFCGVNIFTLDRKTFTSGPATQRPDPLRTLGSGRPGRGPAGRLHFPRPIASRWRNGPGPGRAIPFLFGSLYVHFLRGLSATFLGDFNINIYPLYSEFDPNIRPLHGRLSRKKVAEILSAYY